VCAVTISGHHRFVNVSPLSLVANIALNRSLVTTLRAAEKFDRSHLSSPTVAPLIDVAQIFYVEAYFLIHGFESTLFLAQKASNTGKVGLIYLTNYRAQIASRFLP
jgi:hypothetical protein